MAEKPQSGGSSSSTMVDELAAHLSTKPPAGRASDVLELDAPRPHELAPESEELAAKMLRCYGGSFYRPPVSSKPKVKR